MPKTRSIKFSPVITNDILTHPDYNDGNPFVVDFETVRLPKEGDEVSVDYEHETDAHSQIGNCFDFAIEDDGITARGVLISSQESDIADTVLQKMTDGITYGASPGITLDDFDAVDIPAGQSINVKGKIINGPFRLYRNAEILSVAVTRYPTDKRTRTLLLSRNKRNLTRRTFLLINPNPEMEVKTMADEKVEDTTAETGGGTLLKQLADKIGPEKAIAAFEKAGGDEGLQKILEAFNTLADNGIEFNAAQEQTLALPSEEEEKKEDTPAPEKDDDDEKKELSKMVSTLSKQVAELTKQSNTLAAHIKNLSISDPVSGGTEPGKPPKKEGYDSAAELAKLKNL